MTFKNSAPFRLCILKTNNTFIENVVSLVFILYNLLEYSGNYSMMSESSWNYYRDKINADANESDNTTNNIITIKQ